MDEEFEEPEPLLGGMQEGEEWIARLESDRLILQRDIVAAQGVISEIGLSSLHYSFERTDETIEQIKLEMMLLIGDDFNEQLS